MSGPLLKVCGLRLPDQAAAVASLGVDAIGVIAVPGSRRRVPAADRPGLFAAVASASGGCRGVLVVADPGDEALPELEPERGHGVLQLHGDETPQRCAELGRRLSLPIWKAFRIRSALDLNRVADYEGVVEAVLLDAWVPDQLGGTGHAIPIGWLRDFEPPMPWWLAGGITPERIEAVLDTLSPTGVDVSSGVEKAPGDKDLSRVALLLERMRGRDQ